MTLYSKIVLKFFLKNLLYSHKYENTIHNLNDRILISWMLCTMCFTLV